MTHTFTFTWMKTLTNIVFDCLMERNESEILFFGYEGFLFFQRGLKK